MDGEIVRTFRTEVSLDPKTRELEYILYLSAPDQDIQISKQMGMREPVNDLLPPGARWWF